VSFALPGIVLALLFLPARQASGPRPGFDWIGMVLPALFLIAKPMLDLRRRRCCRRRCSIAARRRRLGRGAH
jgi:hypothetical protein